MRDFAEPLPQASLNIEGKKRSNIFAWRGQFSPQLVESLLAEYCPPGSVVVDPFAGSGTVLCEAARRSLPAFGFEINPSAWCFSKLDEDVLSLRRESGGNPAMATTLGRSVAGDFLRSALQRVPEKNKALLSDAIDRIDRIEGTPIFDSLGKCLYMK